VSAALLIAKLQAGSRQHPVAKALLEYGKLIRTLHALRWFTDGRVTIAGSRLDVEAGRLWCELDPMHDAGKARRASGCEQWKAIRGLTATRLCGDLQARVLRVAGDADAARGRRNDVVHQDWVQVEKYGGVV